LDEVDHARDIIDLNLGEFGEYGQEPSTTHCTHPEVVHLMAQRTCCYHVAGLVVVMVVINVMALLILWRAPTTKTAGVVVTGKYVGSDFAENYTRIERMLIVLPPKPALDAKHGLITLAPHVFAKLPGKRRAEPGAAIRPLVMLAVIPQGGL
jgi:hypothetical protein